MITVSLCMIVKDEEKVIGRCLDSVSNIVDEINIVDTGSTDKTKEIVSQYTDRVFNFEWIDDFAAARNFAFEKATQEYILWLDADDLLSEEDQKKFVELKNSLDTSVDAVAMDYHLTFDSQGKPVFTIRRNRLAKRSRNFKWHGAVHEYLSVGGNIVLSEVAIQHHPLTHDVNRNIGIYERRLAKGEEFTPRDLYYYANELKDHSRIEDAIKYYVMFLETKKGWVEDNIQACYKLSDCYTRLGKEEDSFQMILETLKYDEPRAETCYKLGSRFLEKKHYNTAIYWFKEATQAKDSSYFNNVSYKTWMPHLQLCVCYDLLGKYNLAYEHNEKAAEYQPNHPSIQHNKKYFKTVMGYDMLDEISALVKSNPGQLSVHEYLCIAKVVRVERPCNLLVFGVGNDSPFWLNLNKKGETIFLEHDEHWLNTTKEKLPNLNGFLVRYSTKRMDWKKLLLEEEKLEMDLPEEVTNIKWDIIIVDGPTGYMDTNPGRMQSIYLASKLASKNSHVHVFVHDCHREIEKEYSDTYLKAENLIESIDNLRHYYIGGELDRIIQQ